MLGQAGTAVTLPLAPMSSGSPQGLLVAFASLLPSPGRGASRAVQLPRRPRRRHGPRRHARRARVRRRARSRRRSAERLLDPAVSRGHSPRALTALSAVGFDFTADGRPVPGESAGRRRSRLPNASRCGSARALRPRRHAGPDRRDRADVSVRSAAHQTFVNVYEGDSARLAGDSRPAQDTTSTTSPAPRQGVFAVVRRFVPAGVHHILIGPDHLLFLVGLLLLGGTIRRLAARRQRVHRRAQHHAVAGGAEPRHAAGRGSSSRPSRSASSTSAPTT